MLDRVCEAAYDYEVARSLAETEKGFAETELLGDANTGYPGHADVCQIRGGVSEPEPCFGGVVKEVWNGSFRHSEGVMPKRWRNARANSCCRP